MSLRPRLAARRLYRPLVWRLDELRASHREAEAAQHRALAAQSEALAAQFEELRRRHEELRSELLGMEQARVAREAQAHEALDVRLQQLIDHVHERFVALRAQLLELDQQQRLGGDALQRVAREIAGPQELVAEWTQLICGELRELRAELEQLRPRETA